MKHAPPLVCAVVLNWNQADETVACVHSLLEQTYCHFKVIVVDNGSDGDSVKKLQAIDGPIDVILNRRNLGFAGGMNSGIRAALQAQADWILVLNNDTIVAPNMVAELLACATENVGVLAPLIYYAEAARVVWSKGGQIQSALLEVDDVGRGQIDNGKWPTVVPVDFVPGCAMMISSKVMDSVGMFDAKYFMYYEDFDLCLRIRRAGFFIVTVTSAHMWHKVALSSGGSDSPNERYWMARSSVRFFRKNGRFWQLPLIFAWRMGSAFKTTVRLAKNKQLVALKAYWRGMWHGVKDIVQ